MANYYKPKSDLTDSQKINLMFELMTTTADGKGLFISEDDYGNLSGTLQGYLEVNSETPSTNVGKGGI